MVYWLIHTILADVSHLLPLHLLSWPASLIVLFAIKKEANDEFVRRLTLANLQGSSCFRSPHPLEEHSHHLHNRWSQSQMLQRHRSQLNLCGFRQTPCPETKLLASRGIAPCLLVTASLCRIHFL